MYELIRWQQMATQYVRLYGASDGNTILHIVRSICVVQVYKHPTGIQASYKYTGILQVYKGKGKDISISIVWIMGKKRTGCNGENKVRKGRKRRRRGVKNISKTIPKS